MSDPLVDALLPPAILALLALVLVLVRRRRTAPLAVAGLVLFSVQGVPRLLVTPLLLPPPSAAPRAPPAGIVVLASGLPGLLDTSRTVPGIQTAERLRAAAALFRRTGAPILVSGARAPDGSVPVATEMARSLQADYGVHATWEETHSGNLWQSAAASAAILRQAGITDVYLVAEPWELRLSAAVFGAAGLAVTPAPLPHVQSRPFDLTALVPIAPAWLDSTLALRQWAGLACQALASCTAWMARPTPDPN